MPYLNQIWFESKELLYKVIKGIEDTTEQLRIDPRLRHTKGAALYEWFESWKRERNLKLDPENHTENLSQKEKLLNITKAQKEEIKNILRYIERKQVSADMHARLFEILAYFYDMEDLKEYESRIAIAKALIQINGE